MKSKDREDALTLEILQAIEERSDVTQRHLASRTGVALGLANSYLRRCVRKGLVKIQQAPANRYLYYLTRKGFAEKSRLTAEYLSHSFSFYRRASESCREILAGLAAKGLRRIGLYGASDLAEIAALQALAYGIEVVCVCDEGGGEARAVLELPACADPAQAPDVDAWLVTDITDPARAYASLCERFGDERVAAPSILRVER